MQPKAKDTDTLIKTVDNAPFAFKKEEKKALIRRIPGGGDGDGEDDSSVTPVVDAIFGMQYESSSVNNGKEGGLTPPTTDLFDYQNQLCCTLFALRHLSTLFYQM